jgi:tetratricopeptide (TPR) repeat protein
MLILEANADYELGRLDSAKQKYQKIIEIDMDNRNAGDKLKEIDIKIEERVTDNYWDLLARSRIELVSKNFEKAVEFCDEAIKIKPDENAAKKLRSDIIKVRDDDTFHVSLRTASKAIIARNYDEAKRAYDEAKKLKPG